MHGCLSPHTQHRVVKKNVRSSGGGCGELVKVTVMFYEIRLTFWHDCRYPESGDVVQPYISSPEHEVLKVSYCDQSMSVPASVAQLDAPSNWRQEVPGSTSAEVSNILSWRLIVKYFLRSFSPFPWFMKDSCQFLAKECAQYWLTA